MKLQRMAYPSRIIGASGTKGVICRFWMQGKCNRNPCKFAHGDAQFSNLYPKTSRPPFGSLGNAVGKIPVVGKIHKTLKPSNTAGLGGEAAKKRSITVGRIQNISNSVAEEHSGPKNGMIFITVSNGSKEEVTKKNVVSAINEVNLKKTKVVESDPCNSVVLVTGNPDLENRTKNTAEKVCEQSGTGGKGDDCQNSHCRFSGEGFFMRAELRGHNQAISGITLPTGSDKLYSSSGDGTVQIWNCYTGQSARVINLGNKIGSMISEGPWLFAGMPNLVKAMNTETAADYDLIGSGGQVHALAVASDMLFAGTEDGGIAVWKGSSEKACPFQLKTFLDGHSGAVTCLAVQARKLFSGSMDSTIRVWDVDTLKCIETLNGHTDGVMSVVCWNEYLMSCSLDATIKAWFSGEGNKFENVYTHNEEHEGGLALCGMNDAENKPILMCSWNDNSVHLYELPAFKERGRLYSKEKVRRIERGPYGLFFTGDETGLLTVWEFTNNKLKTSSS